MARPLNLHHNRRWTVLCREPRRWQAGLYIPEFTRRKQVDVLEKHNGPELFIGLRGTVTLLLKGDRGPIRERALRPGEALWVDEWHNAYRSPRGASLVVETAGLKSRFMPIPNGGRR
ncbi:MAG: hypothetical protein HY558_07665 [Euryarchaeota archaeon]|nr:hypothetical protein [Euryarchaeota archaeon]